jgi:hypothetical protein
MGPNLCLPRTTAGAAASHEDTSLGHASQQAPLAPPRPAKPSFAKGRAKRSCPACPASVTSQLSLHPSISPAAVTRGGVQSSPSLVYARPQQTSGSPLVPLGAAPLHLAAG